MPQGATPRSLVIHLRSSLTRTAKPGDAVMVSGIFLPQPYTGFKAMRAGLLTTTFLEAMLVTQEKRSYAQTAEDATLRAKIDVRPPPSLVCKGVQKNGLSTDAISACVPNISLQKHQACQVFGSGVRCAMKSPSVGSCPCPISLQICNAFQYLCLGVQWALALAQMLADRCTHSLSSHALM